MPERLRFLGALLLTAALVQPPAAASADNDPAVEPRAESSAEPSAEPAAAAPVIDHAIDLAINPQRGTLRASDRLTLPDGLRQVLFRLHEGLHPEVTAGNAVLKRIEPNQPSGHGPGDEPKAEPDDHRELYRLNRHADTPVTVSYGGRIRHPMQSLTEGMGRSRLQTIGTIGEDGVFLGGYSGWYPDIPGALLRFELAVTLPADWLAVSQGAGPEITDLGRSVRIDWREDHPQDEIQLSAARFTLYRKDTPYGEAQAYLREPDAALAARYLDATAADLARYSKLIGDYPYAKFALVENFWETGYGMPSFTLLGSRVLRLPFILTSSYPHEILHNWWGNGVYVDDRTGNWSEGLTAYLADHLNQEIVGRGAEYRRDQLKAYADYVRDGEDFPLTAFRGRHGSASQAIGYGKMLMTTHMLRMLLGDDAFRQGLRRFYEDNRFRGADFDDLRVAFEQVGKRDLRPFFDQWTGRTGAPELALDGVSVAPAALGGYRVAGRVEQVQTEPPFPMVVPVVVHAEQGPPAEVLAEFTGREARFEVMLPAPPVRIAVDPRFDTFRRLLPGESPVTLSTLFGAAAGLILIPAEAPPASRAGYLALAEDWQRGHPGWEIAVDDRVDALPEDRPVWLLGWENRFLETFTAAGSGFALAAKGRTVTLAGSDYGDVSVVLTARRGKQALGLVAAAAPEALPGLARLLPHYGKYGYLLFSGSTPNNRLKGQWPVADSELMHWFVDARPALELPARPPLVAD